MRIKLLMPPHSFLHDLEGMLPFPPLGLAHLSSFLKSKGHVVDIDDLEIKIISKPKLFDKFLNLQKKYTKNDLEQYLLLNKPNSYLDQISNLLSNLIDYNGHDMIGFSIIETSATDFALLLSKKIKQETRSIIVFGGSAQDISLIKKYNFIDHSITGSGEKGIIEIINKINNQKDTNNHVSFVDKPLPDFEGLPFSCYKEIPKNYYLFRNPGKLLILPYSWSKGCPYRCSFCGNSSQYSDSKIQIKPVQKIVNELKILSNKYNTNCFFILNEYVHINKTHTINLCKEIIKQNLNLLWCGSARCDLDPSMIPYLAKAGLCYIGFGFESGSQNMINKMQKKFDITQAKNAFKSAHENNMWTNLFVIVGFPHEPEKDYKKTFEFINKNIEYIDQISVCTFRLTGSAVLDHPDHFDIQIRKNVGLDKNMPQEQYSYDEINGSDWESIQKVTDHRKKKLLRLMYIHKKIKRGYLRTNTYELFHAYKEFKEKTKVKQYIKDQYDKEKSMHEAEIPITFKSNNLTKLSKPPTVVFENLNKVEQRIIELEPKGTYRFIISGGEPTLNPDLMNIMSQLIKKGKQVMLKTNARRLCYPAYCKKLFDSGLRKISVSVYNNNAESHDNVTNVTGSFDQTIKGINNWKKLGGKVEIRTKLHDENKNNIYTFIDFIMELENDFNYWR